jgi:molybdopterin converting factor small subunit
VKKSGFCLISSIHVDKKKPASYMELTVKLYGILRRHRPETAEGAPHRPFQISLPENSAINDLIQLLQIKDGAVNAAALNGEAVSSDTLLHNGDTISLFPPAAGGDS